MFRRTGTAPRHGQLSKYYCTWARKSSAFLQITLFWAVIPYITGRFLSTISS